MKLFAAGNQITARRPALIALGFAALLAVLTAASTEASSVARVRHIGLASSVPAKDAHVTTAPREIRLTFTGVINVATAGVVLAAADGKKVLLDTLRAVPDSNRVAVAKITGALAAGTYTVNWNAVAADGAKGNGSFTFMYKPRE